MTEPGNLLVEPAPDAAGPEPEAPAHGEVDRYPGSPPFGDTDVDRLLFRGRGQETDEVLHSILSYDLFLVYAVSGMGKTSLLTAGVLQRLRDREYFPVIVRLNNPDSDIVALIASQIRQAGGSSDDIEVSQAPRLDGSPAEPSTLWDMLAQLEIWRGNRLQQLVLIFDQFEELFTLGWSNHQRAAFIAQFGEVVRRHRLPGNAPDPALPALPAPNVKVVLCMREDFIGQLEELSVSVPQILHRRFRLGPLTPEQAEAAICEPAALDDPRLRTQRFSYSQGAAATILGFLRTKDERGNHVLTDAVDPSQLQIICQHVERTILPRKAAAPDDVVEITEGDLGGQQGLRRIVGDFYRRVVESFPPRQRKAFRHLCENGLISQSGRRLSLEEGEIFSHFGVTRDMLHDLVDLRLLRSEPRVGSVYYELAHDTLTEPILAYRDWQRRKRRRRVGVVLLVLLVMAAVVLAGLLLSRGGDDGNGQTAAPQVALAVGDDVSGKLRSSADTALYEVAAGSQPLLVELRPNGFDGALETTLVDGQPASTAEPQVDNWNTAAGPEFAVLAAGTGKYRIAVTGLAPGEFELSVRTAAPRPLVIPGRQSGVTLPPLGEPVVLGLDNGDGQPFVVSVSANGRGGGQVVPSGVPLEIIGPSGQGSRVVADGSGVLSLAAGGAPGGYTVVLRTAPGADASTLYTVSVRAADVRPLTIGAPQPVTVGRSNDVEIFEARVADDAVLFVELRDESLIATAEVHGPDGRVQPIDSSAYAVLDSGPGRYLVFVTSVEPVDVTLFVDAVETIDLAVGTEVHGTIDADDAVAFYSVRSTGDVPLVAQLSSGDDLDAVLGLVRPGDTVAEQVDEVAAGIEQIVVPQGTAGVLLFVVTPFVESEGDFDFSVHAAEVRQLGQHEVVEAVLGPAGLQLFEYGAATDDAFVVAVTTDGVLDASVTVTTPDGTELFGFDGPSVVVEQGQSGTYDIEVLSGESAGRFELEIRPLVVSEVGKTATGVTEIRGPGDVALFDLDIADDDVNAVTISSASDLTVAATVNDSFGPVIFATPEAGATTTLLLSGADDLHRLVVTGLSGSGAVDVAVAPVTPVQLDAEQATSHDVGDAGDRVVFALDPGEQIMAVDLVPSPGVSVDASVISQLGDVLIASDGPSSEPDTLVIDGRIGPVSIVANVAAGPGALRFEPHVVVPEDPLIGGTAFGEIASPGDLAAFELPMDDAVWLQVTVSAPVLDPVLLLFDPSGFPVSGAVGVDGTAQVTSGLFGEPGDYRVVVGGSGATGTFTLRSMESFSEDDFVASSGLDSPGLDDELLRVVAENLTS